MLSLSRFFVSKKGKCSEDHGTDVPQSCPVTGETCSMNDRESCHDARCCILSGLALQSGTDQHQFVDDIWSAEKH